MKQKVKITEVGPRDGLQNEKKILSTEVKLKFIEKLTDAGLNTIEVTSFVRPESIAQMSDSIELYKKIKNRDDTHYYALVPNLKGMENAIKSSCKWAALFTATSESFTKKNINASIDESLKRFEPVSQVAKKNKVKLRGYISTVFGCPYEGKTSEAKCIDLIHKLDGLGCDEISLGDTIGIANPIQVKNMIKLIEKEFDLSRIAMHFHDTRGLAIANILASMEMNINSFDSSAAGIGGCPYAKGATGNVATEDVYHLLNSMGIDTGIDIKKLYDASRFILKHLEKDSPSKYYQFLKKEFENE